MFIILDKSLICYQKKTDGIIIFEVKIKVRTSQFFIVVD